MEVTYDYYRIFYYVAKYKSLTRAAQLLHSNQPNLTRFMNNLEAQLGCRLLIRTNRGVSLTAEGERLFAHVRVAFEQLHEAEQELAENRKLETGSIRIGVTESALHGIMLETLARFRRLYPDIHLLITNYATAQTVDALKNGLVELAVVTTPAEIPAGFVQKRIAGFREILVAAPSLYPSGTEKKSLREAVKGLPLVGLRRHSMTCDLYTRLFQERGVELENEIEVTTMDQVLPIIKAGLGVGFVPEFMAREALEQGSVKEIPLLDLNVTREIILVEEKRQYQSAAVCRMKEMLQKQSEKERNRQCASGRPARRPELPSASGNGCEAAADAEGKQAAVCRINCE